MGLIIPTGIIYLQSLLDNKVKGPRDLEPFNLPFIGDTPEAEKDQKFLSKEHQRSSLAESLRMIRTNMSFMVDQKRKRVK